jgi:hypothetical protein
VSGTVQGVGVCGTHVTYNVVGTFTPGPGGTGAAALSTTSPPNPAFDACGQPFAINWTAALALASCSSGAAAETTIVPVYNGFQQIGTTTNNGTGAFLLTTPRLESGNGPVGSPPFNHGNCHFMPWRSITPLKR